MTASFVVVHKSTHMSIHMCMRMSSCCVLVTKKDAIKRLAELVTKTTAITTATPMAIPMAVSTTNRW